MYVFSDLEPFITIEPGIDCPVKGCDTYVLKGANCAKHGIRVFPSTWVYSSKLDNLLWKEKDDLDLLENINRREIKRESRMEHDNSEDAVTWNVFRFLERNNLINDILSNITGTELSSPEIIYWSYYKKDDKSWSELNKARREFGERKGRGSEPDIIIRTDDVLLFIEAKFLASNNTKPSNKNDSKNYEVGGNRWFSNVFTSDYNTIAIIKKKYELMRFWLLGTWIANELGLSFHLLNLVRKETGLDIENEFRIYIRESEQRKFRRITWESIFAEIERKCPSSEEKGQFINYFMAKTRGYEKGQLRKAFSI